ncbi:Lipase 1 [Colletotrichum siamense]|uniref:Lipase 1 n=1 Tax=Colletotrichum siamense TaxID=690259 RepID=UPI00187281F5|nr:Lipase 1 [Colletotrichum siamense]KAF5515964.1 Lipase 1 [Colletotrichum siamense]
MSSHQKAPQNLRSINSFFGIRYALPPTGEQRWRKPEPVDSKPWPAQKPIVDATVSGPRCIAIDNSPWISGSTAPNNTASYESEDCLLLNVLVPSQPASTRLPVLVNIHGGGYVAGVPVEGDAFVHQAQGQIIFVSIQYRLGVFGFLAGDEIQASGVANAGLLDQREALNWIQRNIHYLSGDPDKVTIMGGSAGGGSVSMQMLLHGSRQAPPFRAAIPEYAWWSPMYNRTWVRKQYQRVLESSSCASLSCLHGLSAAALNNAAWRAWKTALNAAETVYGLFYYGPTIDNDAVMDLLARQFKAGNFTKVPVLVDRDMFEGPYFTSTCIPQVYNGSVIKSAGWFKALTGSFDVSAPYVQRQAIFGASVVDCPSTTIVQASIDAGQKAFKMVFEAGTQLHGATASYLWSKDISFDGASTLGTTSFGGNATLAYALREYVAAFTINLDPNPANLSTSVAYWPEFTNQGRQILHMQDDQTRVAYDFDSNEQCSILGSLSTI